MLFSIILQSLCIIVSKDEEVREMYILKNSIVSIIRNKGRNILIGIIILVIACSSTVTLAIRNTANRLVKNYEESHDIIATISFGFHTNIAPINANINEINIDNHPFFLNIFCKYSICYLLFLNFITSVFFRQLFHNNFIKFYCCPF